MLSRTVPFPLHAVQLSRQAGVLLDCEDYGTRTISVQESDLQTSL